MNNIDKKLEQAMKNKDITTIMHKASKSFYSRLGADVVYTCQINALWKALLNFNPSKNTKFTTYLYRGVLIECLKEIKFMNKSNIFTKGKLHENISSNSDNHLFYEILDEIQDEEERDLIIQRLQENKTINEISESKPYSRETTRKKINHIFDKLRSKFCE